jgi:hypothetical protein
LRYIDLAVAAMIGVSAISGLVAWSPQSGDSVSQTLMLQLELRDRLLEYLQQRGIMWFLNSPQAEICYALAKSSNSSIIISAVIGGEACSPQPEGEPMATLTLRFLTLEVVMEAWPIASA